MIDIICLGLLDLQGARSENCKMKNLCLIEVRTHDPWIPKLRNEEYNDKGTL